MSAQQHKWYIVHATSGSEKRVKQTIIENAEKKNLSELFSEIIIPSIEISKLQKGKEIKVEKKIMPGYVLIKMILTEETWQLVKAIQQVTNFLSDGTTPKAVPESEITGVLERIRSQAQNKCELSDYHIGEAVKIIDGPFESLSGTIDEIDIVRSKLKVFVSIFGRSTPVDLNFSQVQKSGRF